MNRIFRTSAVLAMAALTLFACDNGNDENPTPDDREPGVENPDPSTTLGRPDIETDTFRVGGKEEAIRSAVGGRYFDRFEKEHYYMAATNMNSVTTSSDIQQQSFFMYLLVDKDLEGKDINLMTETSDFTVIVGWGDEVYFSLSNISASGDMPITSGYASVTEKDGGIFEFVLNCAYEGKNYQMIAEGALREEFRDEVNRNSIYYSNSTSKTYDPVRAAFYTPDGNGFETVHLTSAGLEDFGLVQESAVYYLTVTVPADLADGRSINLASAPEGVSLTMFDNAERFYGYTDGIFKPVSGELRFTKLGEGEYEITCAASLFSNTAVVSSPQAEMEVIFSGTCLSDEYVYVNPNGYTYRNEERPLNSAFIEKNSDRQWTVYLSAVENASFDDVKDDFLTVKASVPSKYFTETEIIKGFSSFRYDTDSDPVVFACGSDSYTSAVTNDSGTLTLRMTSDTLKIKIDNTGHDLAVDYVLKALYEGPYTTVE